MDEYEQNLLAIQELKHKRLCTFDSILQNNIQAVLKFNFWKIAQLCADFHEAAKSEVKFNTEQSAIFVCLMTTMYLSLLHAVGNDHDKLGEMDMEEALEQLETWFSTKKGVDDE